jgi:acyl dehydratase
MRLNYGLDRVRFPAPGPVHSRIRAVGEILDVEDIDGGIQYRVQATFEVEGSTKAACVAAMVLRSYA